MHATRDEAITRTIIEPLEASEAVTDAHAEFDVDGIASETLEYSADLQAYVQTVDTDGFWSAVERHAKEQR